MAIRVPNWEEQVHNVLIQFMNATVQFYTETVNPSQGGAVTVNALWTGKARVQPLRAPRELNLGYEASGVRYFRIQVDPDDNPPFFPHGTRMRVLDAGLRGDPNLRRLVFVVNSHINASHRGVSTIEASAMMEDSGWMGVTGIVVDGDTEQPISGAIVEMGGQIFETYSTGTFFFTADAKVEYSVTVEADGYDAETVDNVLDGDEILIELTKKKGTP